MTASKPVVYLLDGKNIEIETEVLNKVATVKALNIENPDAIPNEVYSEAVAVLLYQSLQLQEETLVKFKKLKLISRIGCGFDNVDIKTAKKLGIFVTNVTSYGVEEVADHAMCFILTLFRWNPWMSNLMKNNSFYGPEQVADASKAQRLSCQTLGIVGLGRIGTAVATRAKVFGLKVQFYDPFLADGVEKSLGISRCETLEELLSTSDCVTIHCPLNEQTRNLINASGIAVMKKGAYIVNTARGGIVDEKALVEALKNKHLGAACLDVAVQEPVKPNDPNSLFYQLDNVIITPHSAFYSKQSFKELKTKAAVTIHNYLTGEKVKNIVN